ncbi:MAG TPA: CoA transferase [Acidimicrobiales bacterium]|jgi:crotonobetainyl-CoA:carnitine CoA-transferase CaiB-like acyl-CoA transferase|nr:CoA transferase [Acidimicrobiales bacterium]
MTDDPLPLAGLRVIDVGTRISAPFCAGLLGEMGAEVIKVEDPRGGDFMRTIGPFAPTDDGADDYSLWWAVEGRGRKGVTLDLRQARGQDLFRRLAAHADVVCENFRPGTLEAWNIGPEDCDLRVVWARISVFGQDGPNARRPGLDRMGIAFGGLLNLTGYPDRPPVRPGVTVSDYLTGVFAAEAVTAALYRRDRPDGGTGRGGVVDAPLYGSILRILEWTIAGQDRLGLTRGREGNRLPNSAPLDNYLTADGRYVCIVAGSDANFARLCAAMGRPDLVDDPRWSTLAQRAAGSDEINGVVADWAGALSSEEVEARCIEHGVPVGTIYDAADILADPHVAARGDIVTVDDPVAGPLRQQAPFPRLDGQAPRTPAPAPALGQHNREVWSDLVGLSADELAALQSAGVV